MDAEALKQTLRILSDTLPLLPDRVAAAVEEGSALKAAAAEFREGLDARQAEAGEIFARLDAALAELRRESLAGAAQLAEHDPAEELRGTDLGSVQAFFLSDLALKLWSDAWEERQAARKQALAQAQARLREGLHHSQELVDEAVEVPVVEAAGLQGTAGAARVSLGDECGRLGAEIEAQRAQGARDMDELAKDLTALEGALVGRLERAREAVRVDGERIGEEIRRRLEDLRDTMGTALSGVWESIRVLESALRNATEEATEGRRTLVPLFDELEGRLSPLRQAIDSVREAARSVGIAF